MGDFLFYLLKSSCYLIIFYLLFKLLMSGTTFFRFNRVTLLVGIVGCMFLPLLEFTTEQETFLTVPLQTIQEILIEQTDGVYLNQMRMVQPLVNETGNTQAINWWPIILGYLYLAGAIFTLFRILLSFYRMFQLMRIGEKCTYGKYQLVIVPQPVSSFSWGKYIVVSASDYTNQIDEILLHETMHLRYRHTLDLLLMQFLLAFCWFNPAIWLLKRELQEVHEFEADNGVLNTGIDATKYQLLLVKKAVGTRLYSMANGFNHSKLKKRITMMLKERTNRWARLKLLFVVPVMAGTLYAFAQPEVKEKLNPVVEGVDSQGKEESYWELIEFFNKERAEYYHARVKRKESKGTVSSIYMNRFNELLFNEEFVDLENLQSCLENHLYTSWKKNDGGLVSLFLQFDKGSDENEVSKMFRAVKDAYVGVREKIALESSNSTKAYLDSVLPILVNEMPPRNYAPNSAQQKNDDVITNIHILIVDASNNNRKELTDFTLESLKKELKDIQSASENPENIVVSLNVGKNRKIGILTDVKQVLRDCKALKVNCAIEN